MNMMSKVVRLYRIAICCTLPLLAWGASSAPIKPRVIIAPFDDRTSANYGWSLSEEFTERTYKELKEYTLLETIKGVRSGEELGDPFMGDLSWTKQAFRDADFVAFAEIAQHTPCAHPSAEGMLYADIFVALRVRVIDLRKPYPTIVLQETIIRKEPMPTILMPGGEDFPSYEDSPLDSMHAKIAQKIAAHIARYTLAIKKPS